MDIIEKAWKKLKSSGYEIQFPVHVPIESDGVYAGFYSSLAAPEPQAISNITFDQKVDFYQLGDTKHEITMIYGRYGKQTLIVEISANAMKDAELKRAG
jgi:hypothetical protein